MLSGDPEGLTDAAALARCAIDFAKELSARQAALPTALYGAESSEYEPSKHSQFVLPANVENAQPLIVGDKGKVLASLSIAAGGRSAGYGANILHQFEQSANLAHAPAFRRLLSWLLTADASKPLPSSIKLSYSGIDPAAVENGFKRAGVEVSATACDFSVTGNCGNGSQLLLLGSDVTDNPVLETQVAQLLASGQPVLYVHTKSWGDNKASLKMLAGMGMLLGGYGGNFFAADAVAPGRTAAANKVAVAQFAGVLPLLRRMVENDWRADYDWGACRDDDCSMVAGLTSDVLAPAELFREKIDALSLSGRNVFEQPSTNLYRLLVLWADVTRRGIKYPMSKERQAGAFMQAVVADSLVAYVRPTGGAQPDLGTFMNGAAARFEVSATDEVVTIPLTQESGFTALGRFAIPGKTLAVQVVDAAGATLSLQINIQEPKSTKLWSDKYDRPRFVRSPAIALNAQAVTYITSPYGGTLQLVFAGAPADAKVRLRIRGVAQHPFLDLSNGGKVADFIAKFNATAFDWAEIKLPGVEVHTRVDKMKEALKDSGYGSDLDRYLKELRTYVIEDAYQLAGLAVSGKSLPTAVLKNCTAWGWDCTSDNLHRLPGVQHFNVDLYAKCGSGCAGNPADISWGFSPRGWGESHELGHNLQQNVLNVYAGRSVEVSNNMFPLHKNWRLLRELGVDLEKDRVGYRSAFDMIVAARAEADPVQGAYRRIWGSADYAAQNGERMAFYIQWVHYWAERTGDRTRGWEIFTQLYLHQRLLARADWAAYKAKLGYGNYTIRPGDLNGNDNLLIALSWMTERDQRATFDLWGITYSAAAAAQVSSYGFAKEAALFYANNNTNNHDTTVRIDMTASKPAAWPF
ncbi:ImpA family metalloprotease [Variovorax paradoxus]|uniref:ImpA family metalloprotease n=1 Tax=Variovorax paradoxus TaxID=34073 RepID=UPI0021AC303B|nr:ImpA family metalloprotease [Variovorax paradoxus]UVH55501.1 ImpA family metalloprotease [Variovorax paradoxus]